ncbi:hypothetical protein SAMN05446635_8995 [Burkholderia sp. OK233]|nr:hypothetical protein SAMN05446635_8995 [Burkholderia sp. OK233]
MTLSFTTDAVVDGELQFAAGIWFVTRSRLLKWGGRKRLFFAPGGVEAECLKIDKAFGRVACWTTFSIGAEYLLKGALLGNGIEIRGAKPMAAQPKYSDMAAWCSKARRYKGDPKQLETTEYADYGALTHLLQKWVPLMIDQHKPTASTDPAETERFEAQADLMYGAFVLLTQMIRNRDAHAYVPNVRNQHENLLVDMFVPAFNTLVDWMPKTHAEINESYRKRKTLVQDLVRPTLR